TRVTLLGQRVPAVDLGRAVAELRPDVVGLSAVNDRGEESFHDTLSSVVRALPEGVSLWVGGPAALAHPDVCERLGARVFADEEDWLKLAG
ncbi:transcriptional regulator, partial [Pyxidicoccus sp. 3LG]